MVVPLRFMIALALALEVLLTVLIAIEIGALWTFVWFVASFLLGVLVMRRAGTQAFAALRGAVPPTGAVAGDTVLLFVAGVLLAVPGFLTDLLGILLLMPPLRHLARRAIARSSSRTFGGMQSTFTTVRLADGSIVIPGEVVEEQDGPASRPQQPGPPGDDDQDPPALS